MRTATLVSLGLLGAVLMAVLAGLSGQDVQATSVVAIEARVRALQPGLAMVRLAIIAALALGFPALLCRLQQAGHLDARGAHTWSALRWRLVAWLVILELVLGQALAARLLGMYLPGVPWP